MGRSRKLEGKKKRAASAECAAFNLKGDSAQNHNQKSSTATPFLQTEQRAGMEGACGGLRRQNAVLLEFAPYLKAGSAHWSHSFFGVSKSS